MLEAYSPKVCNFITLQYFFNSVIIPFLSFWETISVAKFSVYCWCCSYYYCYSYLYYYYYHLFYMARQVVLEFSDLEFFMGLSLPVLKVDAEFSPAFCKFWTAIVSFEDWRCHEWQNTVLLLILFTHLHYSFQIYIEWT